MADTICTKCGAAASVDAQFCNQCGSPLPPQQAVPSVQGAQPGQPAYPPSAGAPYYGGHATPYAQPAAQGYGAQGPYIPGGPRNKLSRGKVALIAAICVVALAVAGVIIGLAVSKNYGSVPDVAYYEIGSDRVPSVSHALGEDRRVSSSETGTGRDMETLTIVYNVSGDAQGDDMGEYFDYLCSRDGFEMMDGAPASGLFSARSASGIQAFRASSEDGYLVVVQADYDGRGYTITVMRGEGESPQADTPPVPPSQSALPNDTSSPPAPSSSASADDVPPTGAGGLLPAEEPVSTNTINGLTIASYADGTVSVNDGNVILTPDGRLFIDGEELPNNGSLAVPEGGTRINVNTCQVVLLDGDIYIIANGCVVYIEGGSYAYLYTQA